MKRRNLLLVSSSVCHPTGYLDHCSAAIVEILDGVDRVLFVPWALHDLDGYAEKARQRFAALGKQLDSIHEAGDPVVAASQAEAFFVGGGNTFRLLKRLQESGAGAAIRDRVAEGAPYIGTSAGTNVATASIRTTNDMPIVESPSFVALGLVPFNINPHYLDADPTSTHQGETREDRLQEFLEENDRVVVALREGSWLRIDDSPSNSVAREGRDSSNEASNRWSWRSANVSIGSSRSSSRRLPNPT